MSRPSVRPATVGRLVVLATALLLTACGRGGNDGGEGRTWREGAEGSNPREEEAVPVEVAALERGPIEATLRYSATLEAERDVMVLAEASRRVVELRVEEGDRARLGELLVRLQDEVQRSALAKAEIRLADAKREFERQQSLYDQSLISEQTWIAARSEYDQAVIAVEDARRELDYTRVTAPIGGTVTERMVNLGDFVTVNQPLFRIVDFDSIVARIYVPEKELASLEPGLEARVTADALEGRRFAGRIDRIAPAVDPATGTVKVTVAIPRQEGLRPGMYVQVELVTATHENAVLLPKRAVVYDNDQMFVFRLGDERRVERIEVEPRLETADTIEPEGRLAGGDQVVVAGQSGLKDGALVRLPGDPVPGEDDEDDQDKELEDDAASDGTDEESGS
jgi:membrane fusion protein (multidrug efflux system)